MIFGSKVIPPVFWGVTEFQNQFFQKLVIKTRPKLILGELRCIRVSRDKNYDLYAPIRHILETVSKFCKIAKKSSRTPSHFRVL